MTDLPARYRKRPIPVEARQLLGSDDGQTGRDVAVWCGGSVSGTYDSPRIFVPTLEGDLVARVGDWIVKGPRGEFWPVKGAIFAEYYEPAGDGPGALRDRIAEELARADGWEWAAANFASLQTPTVDRYRRLAEAVLAMLPVPADRGAVLREAAEALGRMDYDTDSNDYGYDTYRDAWNGGVMDGAEELRRLVAGAQARCGQDIETALGTYPCEREAGHHGDCDERTEAEIGEQQPAPDPTRMAAEAQQDGAQP